MSTEGLRGSRFIAVLAAAALWLGTAAHGQEGAVEEILWSADSWARSGNTYVIRSPRIEGGELLIEADEAVTTSLELNARWELSGSIVMAVGTARLEADGAVFEFEGGELVAAELAGDPATFEETAPEQAGPVRGEAMRIVYDSEAGTVQMQGGTRFVMGQHSMSGCDFLYDLEGGLESGSNECGVPLAVTFVPQNDEDAPEGAAAEADASEESTPDQAPPSP